MAATFSKVEEIIFMEDMEEMEELHEAFEIFEEGRQWEAIREQFEELADAALSSD